MQFSTTFKIAALAVASVMALSSTAYAGGKGGRDGRGSNTENSCAAGNDPVYGANCTN